MLYWLSISLDQYAVLKAGAPYPGLLSRDEQAVFAGLKTPKRRQDWLLGRLAAKLLVQAMLYQETGDYRPLDALAIGTQPNRAPYAAGEPGKWISLSLSHSGTRAVCAAVDHPSWAIGVDIEQIAARQEGFPQEYLTDSEINLMHTSTDACTHNILLTSIWSAKEAVFKALQVGLSVDTKAVTCLFDPANLSEESWHPLEIRLNDKRLLPQTTTLQGWRRCEKDYVISLVVQDLSPGELT